MTARVEFPLVVALAFAATVAVTGPLAFEAAHVGRIDNFDGQFSIWNVAWVARTIVVEPLSVFDANIFWPARNALAFSEHNLGAGILAAPIYWATGNPYLAHNWVLLWSFMLSGIGAYYLARHLTGDRWASAAAAPLFAFCPYVFARTPHIQLLMTAGLPFGLLAWHRLVDRPSLGRAGVLALTIVAQAIFCGYYAAFLVILVATAALVRFVQFRGLADRRCWTLQALAFAAAALALVPLALPYLEVRDAGFHRSLDDAALFSADWRAYFASGSPAHGWLLSRLAHWDEVLFPGVIATLAACAAVARVVRRRSGDSRRDRRHIVLYGTLALVAGWLSFGPQAGLYRVVYAVFPVMQWLRAPARFGVLVPLAFAMLTAFVIRDVRRATRYRAVVGIAITVAICAELATPLRFSEVVMPSRIYEVLKKLPAGAVAEFPYFFSRRDVFGHSSYMLRSAWHWKPLVNGYSDYLPDRFLEEALTIADFPGGQAVPMLRSHGTRYVLIHMSEFSDGGTDMRGRLATIPESIRAVAHEGDDYLYELVPASN
jgi:hypothetical protein